MPIWKRKRKRRLLRGGQIFLVTVILILLAAWNTNNNLFYLLFGGLATFLVLSIFFSGYSVRKLKVEIEAPTAVHRDQPFALTVRLINQRKALPSVSVRVENIERPGVPLGYVVAIPAGRAALLRTTSVYKKRGVFPLPEVVLVTGFPFGLIEQRLLKRDPREIVVYPRIVAVRTAVVEQAHGVAEIPQISQGLGDEYFSLREYVPGDDLRRIAWRATARLGNVMVKELEQQTSRNVIFVFDSRWIPDLDEFNDRFEDAVELIASLAVTLLNRQYAVSLITPTVQLPEGEGQSHAQKLLDMLARISPADLDAPHPFSSAAVQQDRPRVTYLFVSPDPRQWGQRRPGGFNRVIDPREVVHA